MNKLLILTSFLCLHIGLEATERSPWFGKVYEVETQIQATVETYRSINTKNGTWHRPSCDAFFDLSASTVRPEGIALEFEAITAVTRHRNYGFDSLLLTGRYPFMNDVVGDPLSITAGITLSKVFKPARHDLGIFHHGGIELEAHVAAGKEFSCMQFWTSRVWGVYGVGIADLGSPWMRGDLVWEHNWWDTARAGVFVHTLWGLGHRALKKKCHFHGYGPIHHQSIDLGVYYRHDFYCGIALTAEYAFRAFARNCPQHASFFILRLLYPFGL